MTLQWMGQGRQSCRGWINLEEVRDEFVLKALLNSVSQCISLLGFWIWRRACRSLQARAWSHGLICEIILALLSVQKSHKVPGLSLSFNVSAGGGHEENEIVCGEGALAPMCWCCWIAFPCWQGVHAGNDLTLEGFRKGKRRAKYWWKDLLCIAWRKRREKQNERATSDEAVCHPMGRKHPRYKISFLLDFKRCWKTSLKLSLQSACVELLRGNLQSREGVPG